MKYTKLNPNLIVREVEAAVTFYQSVLGFQMGMSVPDDPPLAKDPLGGTLTLFLECEGIEDVLDAVQKSGAKIVMPLKTQFYGMREFAFQDPAGWTVTMAEGVK